MFYFLLFLVFAVPGVILLKGARDRRKALARQQAGPQSLVGCIGTTVGTMGPGLPGKVVVLDPEGQKHTVTARVEDVVIPCRPGQEVLVIEDPDDSGHLVVVPATDIPRLEAEVQ